MTRESGQIRELLLEANQLSTKDLNEFFVKVREMLSKRSYPVHVEREADLLLRIQEIIPVELLEKAGRLHEKRRKSELSAIENHELLGLTEMIEKLHVKRLQMLLELSQIREMPLRDLMDQLGIEPYLVHG